MEIIRKVIAILAAVGFLVTAVTALFVVNLAQVATDRQAVSGMFRELPELDGWLRAQVPDIAVTLLEEQMALAGLPPLDVDPTLLTAAALNLIPPQWVETQTETAVNAIYDYLETGDPAAATTRLDIQPLLERLQGDAGRQMVALFVRSLPPCSAEDVGALLNGLSAGSEIPACLPPGINQEVLADQVHTLLVQSIQQNPQLSTAGRDVEISLLENIPPARLQQLQRLRQMYLLADRLAWVLWLLPLAALFVIALFAVRSLRTLGLWWGWPLTLAGGLALLVALAVSVYAATGPAVTAAVGLPVGAVSAVTAVWQALVSLWLDRVYMQSALMLGAGLLLLGLALVSGRRTR